MLIQQTPQNSIGMIKELPASLLANLTIGQRIEAVVLTTAVAAEVVKLRAADTVMELKTPVALKQGQTVTLELVQAGTSGKQMLQLVPTTGAEITTKLNNPVLPSAAEITTKLSNPLLSSSLQPLKVGQQVSVEVVKVLADNRLLLNATDFAKPNLQQTTSKPVVGSQQFDIDISRLNTTFKANDKLIVEIVNLSPLAIKLKADHSQRNDLILDKIRQLLPQQPVAKTNLDGLVQAHQKRTLPEPVMKEFRQLLQHVIDKPALVKPDAFRQAIQNSGVFLEKQLLTKPSASNNDFKANLGRLITVLESVIAKTNKVVSSESKIDLKTLPKEIQSALTVLAKAPQDLSKLPAQIQTALAATGKTPTQLLSVLIANLNSLTAASDETKTQQTTLTQLITKPDILIDKLPVQTKVLTAELMVLRELLREVEGVHAKIQFNQLAMLKDPDSPTTPNVWLLDLPLKDKNRLDMLQVHIEQHSRNNEEDEDDWHVQLTLDTRNLGPLQATINMCAENVNVMLCAQWPESAALLADNMTLLNDQLTKLGVTINNLSCRCGEVRATTISASDIQQSTSLLDISV